MGKEMECNTDKNVVKEDTCENPIFESKEEMRRSLIRLCYGNLYVIGRLWLEALQSFLVGTKMCLIPTIKAAAPRDEPPPKKPPKMKYKDLPLYETPHAKYNEHEEDKCRCADRNKKMLQNYLYPSVSCCRKSAQKKLCEVSRFINRYKNMACDTFQRNKRDFKDYMRSDEREPMRYAIVGMSTLAAFILGRRKNGLFYKGAFWGGLAYLASGWLCFPKETDHNLRNFSHTAANGAITSYNLFCGKKATLDRGPCALERPEMPKPRDMSKLCPATKKRC